IPGRLNRARNQRPGGDIRARFDPRHACPLFAGGKYRQRNGLAKGIANKSNSSCRVEPGMTDGDFSAPVPAALRRSAPR
ncbi:MAG: hypothetical protein J0I25_02880, partial [Sphingomonadales bacterium]|nr:hypothetical protein [Sphingomonadales bacterium]